MRVPGYLDRTGRVLLPRPPRVRMDRVSVWVEIPEAALETLTKTKSDTTDKVAPPVALSQRTKEMLAELDAIRTNLYKKTNFWSGARITRHVGKPLS